LNTIIELVLRVAGLVEAEGRVAKRTAIRVVIASCIWALATVLLAVGLILVAAAIFLALAEVMHPASALLVVALIIIAAAGACALLGRSIIQRRPGPRRAAARERAAVPSPTAYPQVQPQV
jgi:hypothetical protein